MDLVDISSQIKKITDIGKSTVDKQRYINVSDVWHLWDLLTSNYDLIEFHNIMMNFVKDEDFKIVLNKLLDFLHESTDVLEEKILEYAIPLPSRPRQESNTSVKLEFSDKYIFVRTIWGVGSLLPMLTSAFLNGSTPTATKIFKDLIVKNLNIYDNLSVYGKAKGYLEELPIYNPWA
ncbi:MAG: DUF3231 family protein [Desulfitobacteriaceae bacterium]|nr:DUF3231 family protein [Desulfitobacteriaceae bacterium]MDD4347055.1 DUF3231 family protein [Desulfitobacteriaceae bacterium]MDD4402579.1 DUF3231 family protein [Desulfitobacteriaceae bacterium]